MFIAGLVANIECNLNVIIALSTLRQLGLMIVFIFIGLSSLAFFHLCTHALFRPDLASSQHNLYDIYHYCVYSEKMLMMDRGTVRNMQSFIPKINLRN